MITLHAGPGFLTTRMPIRRFDYARPAGDALNLETNDMSSNDLAVSL